MSALLLSDVVTGYVTNCDVHLCSVVLHLRQTPKADGCATFPTVSTPRLTLSLCLFVYGNIWLVGHEL